MDRELGAPFAGWLGLSLRQQRRLLGLFGSLVAIRYSFLIIHAVDQMRAESPAATNYSAGHEQLLVFYIVWMLGLLAAVLPAMLADSPRLMRMAAMAINLLLLALFYVHE